MVPPWLAAPRRGGRARCGIPCCCSIAAGARPLFRYGDTMTIDAKRLRANLDAVEERIANACARAGRQRAEVTLVAVTKTVAVEVAALLPELGVLDLGENRPQELWRKAETLPANVRWHLIGHLQRNKIERTLPLVQRIHAVDSVRLLQALEQEAARQQRQVSLLLEVNASGEASKQGFAPTDLPGLVPILSALRQVQVHGLMTMAEAQDPQACRPTFAQAAPDARSTACPTAADPCGRASLDGHEQRFRDRHRGRGNLCSPGVRVIPLGCGAGVGRVLHQGDPCPSTSANIPMVASSPSALSPAATQRHRR